MELINKAIYLNEKIFRKLGFRRLSEACEIVRVNGGLGGSFRKLFVNDDLKKGELVGVDDYGNKYYQNDSYFFGRNRWINYADHVGFNYDASQVPPEWYGWLHYKTDLIPSADPHRPNYPWMLRHTENLTGTKAAYWAYSTTKPKITLWKPKSVQRT